MRKEVFVPCYDDVDSSEWVSCTLCSDTIVNDFSVQVGHLICQHPNIGKFSILMLNSITVLQYDDDNAPINIVED